MEQNMYDDEGFEPQAGGTSNDYTDYNDYGNNCGGPTTNKGAEILNNIQKALTTIENIGKFIEEKGLNKLLRASIIFIFFFCFFNPSPFVSWYEKAQEKAHNERIIARKAVNPQVKMILENVRTELDADRAFIFETHNGGANLNGLPFLYADMTYESVADDVPFVSDEYKNLSQTRYTFMDDIYQNNIWVGTIDEMESVDKELYYRFQKDSIKYLAILTLYGDYYPSGAIGIEYHDNEHPSEGTIRKVMYGYSSTLSNYLMAGKPKQRKKLMRQLKR